MAEIIKEPGLTVDLIDMDKFIRINALQECTDPIFINKNTPTEKGVLSYSIFGTSQEERKNRMAYIDLHGHYMYPLAAIKLASYDRKLADVLYSRKRWKLAEDAIVEDEEGKSGPEFLYSIWGKVKVKEKVTVTTKEVEEFYSQPRDKLFTTKFLVIPPFTRDINTHTNSMTKDSNKINSWYSSLISYTQAMQSYTETFANMTSLTQTRVQNILTQIYNYLMVITVKGQPSKFGMLRRAMLGKSIDYSARTVITAPVLLKDSFEDVPVKFGYVLLPLAYTLSCFFPFMVHALKAYFDEQFLMGGKMQVTDDKGNTTNVVFTESFDENYITKLITTYINSSASRFNLVETPKDQDGNTHHFMLKGRFLKDDTSFERAATITDVLYIVAKDVVKNKHVFITRYPLDNYNGQFPVRIEISTTLKTSPVIIGEKTYQFFPTILGDPSNVFMDTTQFSNVYLGPMGGDLTKKSWSLQQRCCKKNLVNA